MIPTRARTLDEVAARSALLDITGDISRALATAQRIELPTANAELRAQLTEIREILTHAQAVLSPHTDNRVSGLFSHR